MMKFEQFSAVYFLVIGECILSTFPGALSKENMIIFPSPGLDRPKHGQQGDICCKSESSTTLLFKFNPQLIYNMQ